MLRLTSPFLSFPANLYLNQLISGNANGTFRNLLERRLMVDCLGNNRRHNYSTDLSP